MSITIKNLLLNMNNKRVSITYDWGKHEDGSPITRQQIINHYITQLKAQKIEFTIKDNTINYLDRFIFLPCNDYTGILNLRSKDYVIKRDSDQDSIYCNIPKKNELIEITEDYFIKKAGNNIIKIELIKEA